MNASMIFLFCPDAWSIPVNSFTHLTLLCFADRTLTLWFFTVGAVMLSGGVTFDSDQGTLTCISTGGPATTVTWTRDSTTVTQGIVTVLNDPVTAQYTHTLTVTTEGEYTCTVANNKPSSASASTTVAGKMSANHCFGMQTKNQWTLEHY